MKKTLAVIGVGNMARAVIFGILNRHITFSKISLYDQNSEQYQVFSEHPDTFYFASSIADAISDADFVLLAVKPQNYEEVLTEIATVLEHSDKLYISIAAGITSQSVSEKLSGAKVIRVLPNLPMIAGNGVSVICENQAVASEDFSFVCSVFESAGSVVRIQENEMNRIISVTSSSPAYVFEFIRSIYEGAKEQGLENEELLDAICDVVIGSALLLKSSKESPDQLISRVCSKGGTTERAMAQLRENGFDRTIVQAMLACTKRADELGNLNK